MLARLLGRETPETTTLEVIGLVKGTYKPTTTFAADGWMTADKMVKKIDRALRSTGRLMDADSKALLVTAKKHLEPLAESNSSLLLTYRRPNPPPMTYPDVVTDPRWTEKFQAFRSAVEPLADKVFKSNFSADIAQKYAYADAATKAKAAKRDVGYRIAMATGM
ncbi:MAG: hypothetical protein KI792_08950 [Alphaproteobacteria bacterium]|nr:hypothetical protein [Alphaproteobacteria bacterium SS10]